MQVYIPTVQNDGAYVFVPVLDAYVDLEHAKDACQRRYPDSPIDWDLIDDSDEDPDYEVYWQGTIKGNANWFIISTRTVCK